MDIILPHCSHLISLYLSHEIFPRTSFYQSGMSNLTHFSVLTHDLFLGSNCKESKTGARGSLEISHEWAYGSCQTVLQSLAANLSVTLLT